MTFPNTISLTFHKKLNGAVLFTDSSKNRQDLGRSTFLENSLPVPVDVPWVTTASILHNSSVDSSRSKLIIVMISESIPTKTDFRFLVCIHVHSISRMDPSNPALRAEFGRNNLPQAEMLYSKGLKIAPEDATLHGYARPQVP